MAKMTKQAKLDQVLEVLSKLNDEHWEQLQLFEEEFGKDSVHYKCQLSRWAAYQTAYHQAWGIIEP